MEEQFIGRIAQRALIIKDGKVLITRHEAGDHFGLPGGRLHKREEPEVGLFREIKEELGVDIKITGLHATGLEIYDGGLPHYIIVFTAVLAKPEGSFSVDPVEVAELRWIGPDDLNSVKLYQSCEKDLKSYFSKSTS